jgi:hypothetical protein
MRRQPTLAEILSDDTGKIRAEVADLLMDPNVQRHQRTVQQPRPQPREQQRSFKVRWILLGLVILIVVIVLRALNASKPSRNNLSEILEAKHASFFVAPVARTEVAKKGIVIGNNVIIRTQPSIQGEVVEEVNPDDVLNIISFHDGWYEVELFDQSHGYIFGAYLIPQNFDAHPYRVAITKDMSKLLVKDEGSPTHYRVIFPDGQTTLIGKEDVEIYK